MSGPDDKLQSLAGGAAHTKLPPPDLPQAFEPALMPEVQTPDGELQIELEQRVWQRTETLGAMVQELCGEIAIRNEVEQALRASEHRLRLLTDALPVCISYVDAQLRFQYTNATYEKWFGVRREEIKGKHVAEIIGQAAFDSGSQYYTQALSGQEATFERWLQFQHSPARYVHATFVPDRNDDGQVQGFYVLVSDITQRKQAEDEARQHLEALAHFNRVSTMGEMASGLAHELNQPLTALTLQASAAGHLLDALPGHPSPRLVACLREIREQAHRAGKIISLLRRLVQRSKLQRSTIDVNRLIEDVAQLVAPEVREAGIELGLRLAPDLPPVLADRIQIEQVLVNLLRNSVDAKKNLLSMEPSIEVATSKCPPDMIRVTVTDNGCGLEQSEVGRIFDSFFTTKPHGMGMGLTISRSIIEEHGGRMCAEPNPAGGAVLRFELPVGSGAERI